MNINIVSILEKHLPFIPADLNQRKMKAAKGQKIVFRAQASYF